MNAIKIYNVLIAGDIKNMMSNIKKDNYVNFVRYDVEDIVVRGNHSFYTAEMELKLKDGSTLCYQNKL